MFFCLRRSRRFLLRWHPRWVSGLFAALASALCLRFASVAPMRGGTYFLCRRKESKQRKRAHTASPCDYPRAPSVPTLHTVTRYLAFVANASDGCVTLFKHPYNNRPRRIFTAPLRQTVCWLLRRIGHRWRGMAFAPNISCANASGATTCTQFAAMGHTPLVDEGCGVDGEAAGRSLVRWRRA
jgi:hypothetical protein